MMYLLAVNLHLLVHVKVVCLRGLLRPWLHAVGAECKEWRPWEEGGELLTPAEAEPAPTRMLASKMPTSHTNCHVVLLPICTILGGQQLR